MRIAVVCNDTRGGVQPYVALALGLKRAGHEVRAVAPGDLVSLFATHGIDAAPLSGSIEAVLRRSGSEIEKGALASIRLSAREMPVRIAAWTRETLAACEGVDVMTGGVGGMVVGLAVAEKLGRPFVETHLQPVGAPTGDYPGALVPGVPRWLGAWGRRMSHHVTELGIWLPFRGAMERARTDVLGLRGAMPVRTNPVLYGFSRRIVPVPGDGPRRRHVTGYWFLPAEQTWQPERELTEFLARSGPVVSIGFGSMTSADPVATTALVRGAARRAGVRAVLLAGWGGLAVSPGDTDVYCTDAVPHDWLFARVSAVVHHGGAGTTGAALRSGVPSVVVPFSMDQPFWGSRVEALGVGSSIPRKALTETRLADALVRAANDTAMRARAAELGSHLANEDGVARAVECLDAIALRA